MHGGQIAETGTVRELYHNPRHPYTMLLQEAFPDFRTPDEELVTIEGTPPKILGDLNACSFADRCPWAIEECYEMAPPLENVPSEAGDHDVACFRSDEPLRESDAYPKPQQMEHQQ
jgi:oligopeptide/dipeptide ABC transporter ATP-binding protein